MKLTKHVLSTAIGSVLALGATSAMAAAGIGADGSITSADGWTDAGGFVGGCPTASPFSSGDAICSYGGTRTIPTEILIEGYYDFPMDPNETTPNGNSGFAGTPIPGGSSSVGGDNVIRFVPDTQLIEGDEITFEFTNGQFCGRPFLILPEDPTQQPNDDPESFNSSDSDRNDVLLAGTETSPSSPCSNTITLRIGDDLNIDRGAQLLLVDQDDAVCNDCNGGVISSADLFDAAPVIRVDQGLPAGSVVTVRASAQRSGPSSDFDFAFAGPAVLIDVEDQFSASVAPDQATIDVFALIVNDNTSPGTKGFIEDVDDNSIPRRRFDDEYDLGNGCSDNPEEVGGDDVLECDYNSDNTDLERSSAQLNFNNNSNGVVDDYIILNETLADHEFEVRTVSQLASNPLGQVDVPDSFLEIGDDANDDTNFPLMSDGDALTTGVCPGILNNGVDADNLPQVFSSFSDDFVIGVNSTNEDFSDEIIQARQWLATMWLCIDDDSNATEPVYNDRFAADFTLFDGSLSHDWVNNSIVLESVYVNLNTDFNNRFIFHNTAMTSVGGSLNADAEIVGANCRNEFGGGLDLVDGFLPLTIPADSTVVFQAPELIDVDALARGNSGPLNRASCTFFIAGGNDEIQGTSQVIQPGVGAITDSPMLRPGTN